MRREEEKVGITFDISGIEGRVGDFEARNVDIWAEIGSTRVTEVLAGEAFEVHADFELKNYAPGSWTFWSCCLTVYNDTENEPVNYWSYGEFKANDTWQKPWWPANRPGVNVNSGILVPTKFLIKIFCNQKAYAGHPPESEWD